MKYGFKKIGSGSHYKMKYMESNKLHNTELLLSNPENMKILYSAFSKQHMKKAGGSFSYEQFKDRISNWILYGNIDLDSNNKIINEDKISFIAYKPEKGTGVLKINAIVGDGQYSEEPKEKSYYRSKAKIKFKLIKDFS